jgi:hypothetical protein
MSWSVSGNGTAAEVKAQIDEQLKYPLADAPAGIANAGERESIHRLQETIHQVLRTFAPDVKLALTAAGHMGFTDGEARESAYQNISLQITPTS